jgi:hypothetical protein
MAQDNEGCILYPASYPEHKIRRIHARKSHSVSHHAFMYKNEASSSRHSTHVKMTKRKLLLHQMNLMFHLRLLMHLMFLLTNQARKLPNILGANTRDQRLVFGYPRCLFLM